MGTWDFFWAVLIWKTQKKTKKYKVRSLSHFNLKMISLQINFGFFVQTKADSSVTLKCPVSMTFSTFTPLCLVPEPFAYPWGARPL